MAAILILSMLVSLAVIIWAARFNAVDNARAKALRVIYRNDDWVNLAIDFNAGPDHDEMMSMIWCWTFADFYPHLADIS